MEFIDQTLNWIKGEIFEGRIIVLFVIITIVSALLFSKTGTTPGAKAMLFPLFAVGILLTAIAGGLLYNNPKRAEEFTKAYESNPSEFIQSEKERLEAFMSWYSKTRYIMAALSILGIGFIMFWATPIGWAIGIALLLTGLAAFVIDHFFEERAEIYYQQIARAIE